MRGAQSPRELLLRIFCSETCNPQRPGMSDIELPAHILLPNDGHPALRVRSGRMVDAIGETPTYRSGLEIAGKRMRVGLALLFSQSDHHRNK